MHDHDALDRVAQLANIPGPQVRLHRLDSFRQKLFRSLAVSVREVLIEVIDKQRHVFKPVAQWRQLKRYYIQAIEKIRAKVSLLDLNVESFICRGDQANVNCDRRS